MAITQSHLTSGGGSYSASYSSASFTETANGIVFIAVGRNQQASFDLPTKSGLTFESVQEYNYTDQDSGARSMQVYAARAGASPSSGAATIYGGDGHTRWTIWEATGDVSASAISSVVINKVTGNATNTTLTLTLASLESSNSAVCGVFSNYNYSLVTEGSGFTELADGTQNNLGVQVEWSLNDTTVDGTPVSAYTTLAGIGFEIVAAAAGGTVIPVLMNIYRQQRS